MGLFGDLIGLAGDITKFTARQRIGWGDESSNAAEALDVALSALQMYGKDRRKATRLMNDYEIREYDRLIRKYPGGYDEYREKMDKMLEATRLRNEDRCKEDPLGAWIEDLWNEENARKADAEWDMAVDRDNGIYRHRSSYGL